MGFHSDRKSPAKTGQFMASSSPLTCSHLLGRHLQEKREEVVRKAEDWKEDPSALIPFPGDLSNGSQPFYTQGPPPKIVQNLAAPHLKSELKHRNIIM